jgi:hypothetical protein
MYKSNEEKMEDLKELISWHQKACIELAQDMTQDNYNQVIAARLEIIDLFKEGK